MAYNTYFLTLLDIAMQVYIKNTKVMGVVPNWFTEASPSSLLGDSSRNLWISHGKLENGRVVRQFVPPVSP